ncbi:MAG: helix-turn-helix transcriptional regulator [Methanoregulaceae archaeon]
MLMKSKLREFRIRQKLTQRKLAKDVRVARQTIVAIEKGHYNPSLEMAFRLARYFGVPIEELFTYQPSEIE